MKTAARLIGRFFALAVLQAFCGIQNGQCQQAVSLVFTNKVATFTNLQGETFIGAELIEADATQVVFKTNDIFGAVKFTNLSTTTLESLGVPLSRLGLEHDLEVQKAKAIANQQAILNDEQVKLLDPTNLTKLKVGSVIFKDNDLIYGQLYWCEVRQENGVVAKLFVARLPDAIPAYFNQRATLAQAISQLSGQIDSKSAQIAAGTANMKKAQYQVNQANAVTPIGASGDADYVNGVMAQRSDVNLAQVNINATVDSLNDATDQVEAWRKQLSQAQSDMEELNRKEQSVTSLLVLRSHFLHNRFPVVICAQPRVVQSGDSQ